MLRWIAAVGLGCLGAYALLIEPHWIEETHHRAGLTEPGMTTVRVAQVSDLHLQSFGTFEASIATRLRATRPDLVVISGDAIDRPENLGALKAFLEATSDLERVAVLGNWEYWSEVNLADLRRLYEAQRVRLLVNESATYRFRGTLLQVIGLDDFTAGKPSERMLTSHGQADVSLVVQHSPGMFEEMERVRVAVEADLCISGHTHGGQLRLFGWAPWTPPGSGGFTAGMYRTAGCPLYVSRGIGTSLVSARFGSRPEIAVFDIGVREGRH